MGSVDGSGDRNGHDRWISELQSVRLDRDYWPAD